MYWWKQCPLCILSKESAEQGKQLLEHSLQHSLKRHFRYVLLVSSDQNFLSSLFCCCIKLCAHTSLRFTYITNNVGCTAIWFKNNLNIKICLPSKENFPIKQIDSHLIWLSFKKHFWSIQWTFDTSYIIFKVHFGNFFQKLFECHVHSTFILIYHFLKLFVFLFVLFNILCKGMYQYCSWQWRQWKSISTYWFSLLSASSWMFVSL